jgi:hypothetical protein
VAMDQMRRSLDDAEGREKLALADRKSHGGAFLLPSVGDSEARFEGFIQKADHALVSLLEIVKIFYGKDAGHKWFEGLAELIERRYSRDSEFAKYARGVLPTLQLVRRTRNSIEHPKTTERTIIRDFAIAPSGEMSPPTIELIHPQGSHRAISITAYMEQLVEGLVAIFEGLIAHLCANNMRADGLGPFPIGVVMLPENQRAAYHNIRFCWGFYQGDHVVVAS